MMYKLQQGVIQILLNWGKKRVMYNVHIKSKDIYRKGFESVTIP